MDFEKKLDDLLKKDKFIEEDGHYAFIQLSKLFLEEKSLDKNIDFLLQSLDKNIEEDWIWSFVRFLDENLSKSGTEFTQKQKNKIGKWSLRKLENIEKFGVTTVLKILDVLFEINPDSKEQLRVLEPIVENSEEYQILQNILLQLHEGDEYNDIFIDTLLKTMNVDRGIFLGIGYLSKVFVRLGKSPKILYFLDQIKEDKYSKTLEEFLGMYEKSTEEFFSVLGKNKRSAIKKIGEILEKAGRKGIWYGHHAHQKEEFLKIFLKTTHELGLSLFDEQGWLFDDNNFWHIYEFVAPFISFNDIKKYHEKVGNETMHIIRLYEVIKNSPKIRNDRTEILDQFLTLPGFQKHHNRCEKIWAKQNAQMQKTTEKYRKQQKNDLEKMIAIREEGKVLAGLVDKFYRELKSENKQQESIFGAKEIQIVKEEIEKFFKWDLFNLEKPVYQEYTKEDGAKEYRGGYWYQVEFFKNALDLWKNTFHKSTAPFRNKILKSLLLIDTSHVKEVAAYLGKNMKLSDDEAEMFLSVLRKEDVSKVRYHLSGQNIIDIFDLFKESFKKQKFRKKVQEILWSILEDDYYYSFRRVEAISWAHKNKVIDQEWLQKIKSYWTNLVEKDKNYIENFSDEDVIFGINRVLIEMDDEEAILWRINQLKTAKIALTEKETEKAHGGIANEIRWERYLFKCLKDKIPNKYQDATIELLKYAIQLLKEDEKNSPKIFTEYAKYLLHSVFEVLNKSHSSHLFHEVKKLRSEISGYAEYIFGFYYRRFQTAFIDELDEEERKILIFDLTNNQTDYTTKDKTNNSEPPEKISKFDENIGEPLGNKTIFLLVEGASDRQYIFDAWYAFKEEFPFKEYNICIHDNHGASKIRDFINEDYRKDQNIYIGLFDYDEGGIEAYKGINGIDLNQFAREDIRFKSPIRDVEEKKCHVIFYPAHEDLISEQILQSVPQKINPGNPRGNFGNAFIKKPFYCVEHLFYKHIDRFFSKENNIYKLNKEYFGDDRSSKKSHVSKNLSQIVKELGKEDKKYILNKKELYKNFIPIFESINLIINK